MLVELFTDGGAVQLNGVFYGASAYIIKNDKTKFEYAEPATKGTNNHFELRAIEKGIKSVMNYYPNKTDDITLLIISDSQYSISSLTTWFNGWLNINGKYYTKTTRSPVMNIDQILNIRSMLPKFKEIKFIKIKSHTKKLKFSLKLYEDFKRTNHLELSVANYLEFVELNDRCDAIIGIELEDIKQKRKKKRK